MGSKPGQELFAGHTVYAIVLEVPDGELLAITGGKRRIRVWAVAPLATDAGGWFDQSHWPADDPSALYAVR
jgi:hypothetical protein